MGSSGSIRGLYRFGAFEADLQNRELRKHGMTIRVPKQPFDVLTLLLENAGKVVRREELRRKLWPDGVFLDFEHGLNKSINHLRQTLGDRRHSPRFIETLPCIGYRFVLPVMKGNEDAHAGAKPLTGKARLAILPFEELNSEPKWEQFCNGLMIELITRLGRAVPQQLGVIGWNSTIRYKASEKSLEEIGEELRADYILTGAVRHGPNRVRVSVELILASDQTCMWAESYDRDAVDLFMLENDLAAGIAGAVVTELRLENLAGLVRAAPTSAQAREAYLKGRYHYNRRGEEGLNKGIHYFQEASKADPSFGLAYAGLADSYMILENWGFLAGSEAMAPARSAAMKAVALNPELAETHTSLAYVKFAFDRDWEDSEREFQLAIRLNPNYSEAYHLCAYSLVPRGRFNEALEANYRAHELDPLSLPVNSLRGWLLYCAGRLDDAIEQCRQTIEFDPHYPSSHAWLALALAAKGNFTEALAASEIARKCSDHLPMFIAVLGYCYAASGDARGAERVLDELAEIAKGRHVRAFWVAAIYAALKRNNEAFDWLANACQDYSQWVAFVNVDPRFDSLRSDSRFAPLLKKLGLEQRDTGWTANSSGASGGGSERADMPSLRYSSLPRD
jgi:TolB-like protein/Flp pilus assembly protein TadD